MATSLAHRVTGIAMALSKLTIPYLAEHRAPDKREL